MGEMKVFGKGSESALGLTGETNSFRHIESDKSKS